MNKFLPSRVCMFVVAIWSLFTVIPSNTCQAIAMTRTNSKNSSILAKENLEKTAGIVPLLETIKFIGTIQSITPSSVTVDMPDSQKLSMNIVQGQTNLASLKGALPSVGQLVKVTAILNPDGNFTASELALPTADDLTTVTYQGVTTSTVGTDNKLNFKVGTMSFSFPIATTANLQDFNSNVHTIATNVVVKTEVLFNGTAGTVTSIENKQASLKFTGKLQSIAPSGITVAMPSGQKLPMNMIQGQATLKGVLPSVGQLVKVTAILNPDGNFTASELGLPTPDELTTVKYQGVTTSTVGADNKLNFKVGTMSFSFPIATTANLQDFNSNVHTIATGIVVKTEVLFNGTAGTVTSIENEQASIDFIGKVQSINPSSATVDMLDGQELSMSTVGLSSALPSVSQLVKGTATLNPDGSFTASELVLPTPIPTQELKTVSYQGVTTSTVGADNKLNFKVGTMSFSFPISTTADLQDFNSNAHTIPTNSIVKAEVLFNGTAGTVTSIKNGNN